MCLLSIDKVDRRRLIRGGWKLKVRRASRKLREIDETRDTRYELLLINVKPRRCQRVIQDCKNSDRRGLESPRRFSRRFPFSFSNLHSPSPYISSPDGFAKVPGRDEYSGDGRKRSVPLSARLLEKSKRKAKVLRTKYTHISDDSRLSRRWERSRATTGGRKDPTRRRFAFRPNAKTRGGRSNASRLNIMRALCGRYIPIWRNSASAWQPVGAFEPRPFTVILGRGKARYRGHEPGQCTRCLSSQRDF